MFVINANNVRDALQKGVHLLANDGRLEESRAGKVIVAHRPVTTVYETPRQRTLLSPLRDANPFFHVVEGLWMLAGRGDAALLDNFVKDFGKRFAQEDGVIHGAYGARWRNHFFTEAEDPPPGARPYIPLDQLSLIIQALKKDPGSRQAVLQMWDAEVDWEDGLKDRPCNTQVYFRIRKITPRDIGIDVNNTNPDGSDYRLMDYLETDPGFLDMTVTCRSNDIIWGAYGANAVHFSMMQEYMAARIGVEVGRYYQVSNNYHAYVSELDRLSGKLGRINSLHDLAVALGSDEPDNDVFPLVHNPDLFDRELVYTINAFETLGEGPKDGAISEAVATLENKFLSQVAWPMMMAHRYHNLRMPEVHVDLWLSLIADKTWQRAAAEWIKRRRK